MCSIVWLLVAAALVSQQIGFEANAQLEDRSLENRLKSNSAPIKKHKFTKFVRIRVAPEGIVKRVAGDTTVLECTVIANPPPSITWLKNGEVVQELEDELSEYLPRLPGSWKFTSKLVITSKRAGEDKYTCVASSGVLRKAANSLVYTVEADEEEDLLNLQKLLTPSPPVIIYYYDALFQTIGDTLLLPCRVHSDSSVQVNWDHNDERIYGDSRMKILPTGDLLISKLLWDDMGSFRCVAKSMYGRDVAETFVYPMKPSNYEDW